MEILSEQARQFLEKLHLRFNDRRLELLNKRGLHTLPLNFLEKTKDIRTDLSWKVAPTPYDLEQRRVEITGPVSRKMMINALNSGADVFMADFEDANSPTWKNVLEGQQNCFDAIRRTITLESGGKSYNLNEDIATLVIRPRGFHLNEKHFQVEGEEISASFFDFGLYFFHNAEELIKRGSGPYFYLAKLESHLEARLWNDIFNFAQDELGIPRGTIRSTVLIETLPAAFEMEEILYELKSHSSGLNAGRWDYIFSIIKTYRRDEKASFPDRVQITMEVPFMHAYSELLVRSCHKRGAHAIGGMAAFIPNRKKPEVTKLALEKVRSDKIREEKSGFDGTWVAHPDLVPIALEIFTKKNQKERLREDVKITAEELQNFEIEGALVTEEGVRLNIYIALLYIAYWLNGVGAVAIHDLMEDAATAEISRAQLWQWRIQNKVSEKSLKIFLSEELAKVQESLPEHDFSNAYEILEKLIFEEKFTPFLTLKAYNYVQ